MRRAFVPSAIVLSLCIAPSPALAQECLMAPGWVERIEIGMIVDDLYEAYDRSSLRLVNLNLEGMFAPAIEVSDSLGHKRFVVEFRSPPPEQVRGPGSQWQIWRIRVYDPQCRMVSGIGIGSTVGELQSTYGGLGRGSGEGTSYAISREMGMSFALSPSTAGQPDSARVDFILILPPPEDEPE
jgi:hypothetical protein